MKFKVTYIVRGMVFTATAHGASEAFDYAKAIIRENKIMYPDQDEAVNTFFCMIAELVTGKSEAVHSGCGLFSIEPIKE